MNDIIKALDILKEWQIFAYHNDDGTDEDSHELYWALTIVFKYINRQKAELERLKSMNQSKLDMIHDLRAEIEVMNKAYKIITVDLKSANLETEMMEALSEQLGNDVDEKLKYIYELEEKLKTAKAEAVREFAERLQTYVIPQLADGYTREIVLKSSIDNLVKEMVGEHDV